MTRKQQFIGFAAGAFVSILVFTVVHLLDSFFIHKDKLTLRNEIIEKTGTIRAKLESSISERLFLSSGLEAFVKVNPSLSRSEFEHYAQDLGAAASSIRSIQLAQDAKVSHVYPLVGNEAALGHDILNDPERRPAVLQAIEAKEIVLAGPVELKQGGTGLIGRTPIFLHEGDKAPEPRRGASFDQDGKAFWGLAIILIDYDSLIEQAGLTNIDPNLMIAIRGKDGKGAQGETFFGAAELFENDPVLVDISLPYGTWQLGVAPVDGWVMPSDPWSPFKTTGAALSLIFGFLVWSLVRTPFLLKAKVDTATKEVIAGRNRYSAIWENSPIGMQIFDANGKCIMANPAYLSMVGYSEEEVISRSEGAENSRTDTAVCPLEQLLITKSGEHKWVTCTSFPLQAGDDGPMKVCLFRDITKEKRADEERARFNLIIEQTAETVIMMDLSGVITYVNPAFEHLALVQKPDIIGKPYAILYKELQEIEHCEAIIRHATEGQTWRGVLKKYRPNGSSWEENTVISPVKDRSGTIINIVSIGRDVTYERSMEQQLRQSQKIEAVGRLAGGIAHDFNNLLTAINGFAEIISAKIPPSDALAPDVQEIIKAGNKAATLTRQLLAFSRRQVMQPQVIDMNAILIELTKLLRRLIGEHIGLTTLLDKELWRIQVDPHQLEQIIVNLAVNARDAMPNGGTLSIETSNAMLDSKALQDQQGVQAGRWVMVSVADTGIGMDEDTKSRLFEPFFTTKGKGVGTGLGLATVYGIVKQSGGFIRVRSEIGSGTTIRIFFPASSAPEAIDRSNEKEFVHKRGTETILLAEDDEQVRKFAERLLTSSGYKVIPASDGVDALEIMKDMDCADIDLLLTDVVMPNMGGVELAKQVAEQCPNIKILYMSGYAATTFADFGLGEQKIKFVQKPFTKDAMLEQIQRAIHSAKSK